MSKKLPKPKAIVIDIEGTTTDRKFVSKTLFPMIRQKFKEFLTKTIDKSETKELIKSLEKLQKSGKYAGMPVIESAGRKESTIASVENNILWQLSSKLKTTELKSAELLCWVWLYESGLLKSHVYDDVSDALHEWKVRSGIKLYTYSSGMACAQKLLFCNTVRGNLYPLVDEFFDRVIIGPKSEQKSYETIVKRVGVDASSVLYVTDSPTEAKCAKQAGLRPVLVRRPGASDKSAAADVPTVTTFADIKF